MKYTKEERLEIGRQIYYGEISKYEAANKYNISPETARAYMRLYRDTYQLPPKHAGGAVTLDKIFVAKKQNGLDDLESMTKEELIREIVKARIQEARLKKGYEVKGDGSVIIYDKKNIK